MPKITPISSLAGEGISDILRDTASSSSETKDDAEEEPTAHMDAEPSARPKQWKRSFVFVDSDEDFSM